MENMSFSARSLIQTPWTLLGIWKQLEVEVVQSNCSLSLQLLTVVRNKELETVVDSMICVVLLWLIVHRQVETAETMI